MPRLAHQNFDWGGPAVADVAQAAAAGATIGRQAVAAVRLGASDPDHLLRLVLNVLADAGYLIPPTAALRGFVRELQRAIEATS